MLKKCYRCFRPLASCYCSTITPIDVGFKCLVLMHPKEAYRQKTGTGRLTALSIINAEIIIGIDFTQNKRLNALIHGEGSAANYFPVVLYPAEHAFFTDTPTFRESLDNKKLLVILVDATWHFAKKMLRLSTNLHYLPKLSFKNSYQSQFAIKLQPDPACLSTIETAYYLIEELKTAGIVATETDPSGLMEVFHRMIRFQQRCMLNAIKR